MKKTNRKRCAWVHEDIPIEVDYHDSEWGVPLHDDQRLFEFLVLEGAQAGLSWITILKKRENYRRAMHDFDPMVIARYKDRDRKRLLSDAGIVRNRLKINAAIVNAQCFLDAQEEFESFDQFIWGFVDGSPTINRWKTMRDVPAKTATSDRMSKELKRRGFKFVGSTICYAFMQAVGMVNDHTADCFRHAKLPAKTVPRRKA